MSIYGKELDYETKMKNNIELSKILINVLDKDKKAVTDLYNKKLQLLDENSLFAFLKIKLINKKINKYIKENR